MFGASADCAEDAVLGERFLDRRDDLGNVCFAFFAFLFDERGESS